MINIILASTSPRRKVLLKQTGLKFKVIDSSYEEDMTINLSPIKLAKFLSHGKAKSVARKFKNHLIIGADTFIEYRSKNDSYKILGKQNTTKKAIDCLAQLNGKMFKVITGVTIIDTVNNKTVTEAEITKIFMKKLTKDEIVSYVKNGEPIDKAGAFTIQGLGALTVKKIDGDYYNAVGLPLCLLAEMLKKFNVHILRDCGTKK